MVKVVFSIPEQKGLPRLEVIFAPLPPEELETLTS
jgi:hypothetical protein